ncbi:protein HEXIM1-like [Latimeria chalumnae]|uniref:protein HEXIM1-like n=1 Tax=Latimeria chalumnae TaxID=7897 RepID=UPI0003C12C67|nr:PREDICTED: protein HEXIM1-like [Latimeria chalumnae]|eukprot:XP_005994649.1 PREDICTED: protein HEXIM1-like [Latimeria chalumnae]
MAEQVNLDIIQPSKTLSNCAGGQIPVLEHPASTEGKGARWQPREAKPDSNLNQKEVCQGLVGAGHDHPNSTEAYQDYKNDDFEDANNGGTYCNEEQQLQGSAQLRPVKAEECVHGNGYEQKCEPPVGDVLEWQQRQLGKKKHRRRPSKKKRRWKPYYKLSWEEKKALDERETQRASRVRAEMFAKGLPVAPYNTTQFLMEEHDQKEPDLKTDIYPKKSNKSDTSEEDYLEEEEDGGSDGMGGHGGEFLQRDFSETYEKYHAESLQNMSKQELIREYLELEKCLSRLEEENNRLRIRMEGKKLGKSEESGEDPTRVLELELELEKVKAENMKLLKENELCQQERGL